ncbi:SRPBCC family protein [Streptomyces sp. A5-4]|uniref:SRPBCC family protein n=1 Tax=Streptomyces sp. A5-4 TaxID=3384771 RepID=UPI003DA9E2A9
MMKTTPQESTDNAEPLPEPGRPEAGARSPRRRRRWPVFSALGLLVALTGYTVWTNVRPVRLTASIELRATPDEVWQVLADFDAYAEWNPFMKQAEVTSDGGRLEVGARLRNQMSHPSGETTFTPEVLAVDPGRELRWIGRLGPGWLADGEHRFTIESLGSGQVRFTQSERFSGALTPFLKGQLEGETLPQFRAMNEALKERVRSAG